MKNLILSLALTLSAPLWAGQAKAPQGAKVELPALPAAAPGLPQIPALPSALSAPTAAPGAVAPGAEAAKAPEAPAPIRDAAALRFIQGLNRAAEAASRNDGDNLDRALAAEAIKDRGRPVDRGLPPGASIVEIAPGVSAIIIGGPEGGDDGEALAALAAYFDGGRRPQKPSANADSTALSAPSGTGKTGAVSKLLARASAALGLGKPAAAPDSIEGLFRAGNPGSRAVETLVGSVAPDFGQAVASIITQDTFETDMREGLRIAARRGDPVAAAIEEILAFADQAPSRPDARRFVEGAGRMMAGETVRTYREARGGGASLKSMGYEVKEPHRLPPNPLGAGDYWDLAAGINAGNFILDSVVPGTHYHFFDLSQFVVSYLQEVKRLAQEGAAGPRAEVSVHAKNLWDLQRPEKPLAVLRAKNVTAYVRGFERKLDEMTDWIAEGGQLVVQTDESVGQRVTVVRDLGFIAERLIAQGWAFDYKLSDGEELDLLTFTRPGPGGLPGAGAASEARWKDFRKETRRIDPFSMFMQRLGRQGGW